MTIISNAQPYLNEKRSVYKMFIWYMKNAEIYNGAVAMVYKSESNQHQS